jgi:hypothetical protein
MGLLEKGRGYFIFPSCFFFHNMVTKRNFILKKIFYTNQYHLFGHGNFLTQNVNFENLTKRTENILSEIEHLIHLAKKRK